MIHAAPDQEAAAARIQGQGPRARILIVDDDDRNAFAATHALEALGHELVIARSGEEALRRLLEGDFAVILLDLHMPGMDGYETARYIRTHPRTRGIPIVFLTAVFRDEAHLFQAYSAGAVDVVFKPVDPFILRSKVSVLADLHLKTVEVTRQTEHLKSLLVENDRIHAEKISAERALRVSRDREAAITRSLPIVFHSRSLEPPFAALFVSEGVEDLTGFTAADFTGDPEFGLERIHPDDRDTVIRALSDVPGQGHYGCEFRWLCADGQYRHFMDRGVIAPSLDGEPPREVFGTLMDITERRQLEEQLTQARKMEAVGQLTGGVAHDFNNLLTVILGNADLLTRKVEPEAPLGRHLTAIRHAAERGRSLTRQLLAFSRRERLSPVSVDLNTLVSNFVTLMQQAVGEAVTLRTELSPAPVCVEVDPAHLETALLNLAVNARDAMPGGGELLISTSLHAGHFEGGDGVPRDIWARIEVRDSGTGMDAETCNRIFEPFFTTKDVGKGSGLGLSQVYGFVRQSGGHVAVDSALGRGTIFTLYLPPSELPAEDFLPAPVGDEEPEAGSGERLLVVEDDIEVLTFTVDLLQGLGYRVTTASDARTALEILTRDPQIDLLFSDVIMPGGMSGLDLAQGARKVRPTLPILLTSGYVGERPADLEQMAVIDKPYERNALAARLREVLNAPVGRKSRRRNTAKSKLTA